MLPDSKYQRITSTSTWGRDELDTTRLLEQIKQDGSKKTYEYNTNGDVIVKGNKGQSNQYTTTSHSVNLHGTQPACTH